MSSKGFPLIMSFLLSRADEQRKFMNDSQTTGNVLYLYNSTKKTKQEATKQIYIPVLHPLPILSHHQFKNHSHTHSQERVQDACLLPVCLPHTHTHIKHKHRTVLHCTAAWDLLVTVFLRMPLHPKDRILLGLNGGHKGPSFSVFIGA